jgi:hypothetical protein
VCVCVCACACAYVYVCDVCAYMCACVRASKITLLPHFRVWDGSAFTPTKSLQLHHTQIWYVPPNTYDQPPAGFSFDRGRMTLVSHSHQVAGGEGRSLREHFGRRQGQGYSLSFGSA